MTPTTPSDFSVKIRYPPLMKPCPRNRPRLLPQPNHEFAHKRRKGQLGLQHKACKGEPVISFPLSPLHLLRTSRQLPHSSERTSFHVMDLGSANYKIQNVVKLQWSLYFKTTHGTMKMWSYIAGGLKGSVAP